MRPDPFPFKVQSDPVRSYAMKQIKHELSLLLFALGLLAMAALFLLFHYITQQTLEVEFRHKLQLASQEAANHFQSRLEAHADIILTLSRHSVFDHALKESNRFFTTLGDEIRVQRILTQDQKWRAVHRDDDPFIRSRLTNPVAKVLKEHSALFPDAYGEIFLTNRYGVMIASTGRLTTLAHQHKYWWQGGYNGGHGKIFFDDRGFDVSAGNYVLGVVVPIRDGSRIIGMLKANIKIVGPFRKMIRIFSRIGFGELKLVRTNGEIVLGKTGDPLSGRVNPVVADGLKGRKPNSASVVEENGTRLFGYAPITNTMNLPESRYRFGSNPAAIDQHGGFSGFGWFAVIDGGQHLSTPTSRIILQNMALGGLVFMLLMALAAYRLGSRLAQPIEMISRAASEIGAGNLATRISLKRTDEIGGLAVSINDMVESLQQSMASRSELEREVEKREAAEQCLQKMATTDELTGLCNRRRFKEHFMALNERITRYPEELTLFVFDIDHFKLINDNHGHEGGDRLLVELAQQTQTQIREVDLLARWGGDEFVILLPQTDAETGRKVAKRLCQHIEASPFSTPERITISLGLSSLQRGDTLASLLKRADKALYHAKSAGRNCVVAG